MSPNRVVRRLTAVIVLLAVLGLALPAAAASGSHQHQASRPSAVSSPNLFDQLLSWIGGFLPGQTPVLRPRMEKSGISTTPGGTNNAPLNSSDADRGSQIDPNG
jgi:hypothetical protein